MRSKLIAITNRHPFSSLAFLRTKLWHMDTTLRSATHIPSATRPPDELSLKIWQGLWKIECRNSWNQRRDPPKWCSIFDSTVVTSWSHCFISELSEQAHSKSWPLECLKNPLRYPEVGLGFLMHVVLHLVIPRCTAWIQTIQIILASRYIKWPEHLRELNRPTGDLNMQRKCKRDWFPCFLVSINWGLELWSFTFQYIFFFFFFYQQIDLGYMICI